VIAAGTNSSTLSYGAWRNRSKQVAISGGSTETTISVAGLLEKVTRGSVTEYRHRIAATPGVVALYTRRSAGSPLSDTYYVHRDHLGSPELLTRANGTAVVGLSFSAYGERRDTDWDGPIGSTDLATLGNTTREGYTGHAMLDGVGLVHMNGRVYDPVIGRFLSRDPIVDARVSQGANGYAYVWNNPLTFTDPSGYVAVNVTNRYLGFTSNLTRSGTPATGRIDPVTGLEIVEVEGSRLPRQIDSQQLDQIRDQIQSPSAAGGERGSRGGDSGERAADQHAPHEQQGDSDTCRGYEHDIGASVGAYAGPGLEGKVGNDGGNRFGTLRVGFGLGGGASIDSSPSIPGPEFDRSRSGWVVSVTYDFSVGYGPFAWGLAAGASRNLTSRESSPTVDLSASADVGTRLQISLGAEVTHYRARAPSSADRSCSTSGR
jgi:RHS repeat-associated protein